MLPIPPRTAATLAGAAIVLLAAHLVLRAEREKGRAACRAEYAAAAALARDKAQAESFRRFAAQQGNANAQQRALDRDRAAGAALDASAAGLRDAVAARSGGTAADPAAAPGSAPAGAAPDLLSELLGEADARLRSLAKEADARRTAGLGCEADYDALSATGAGGATSPTPP